MTVYADILILVNFTVDYFLLLLTSSLLHKRTKLRRLLLSSALGGIFSLYIFLPQTNFFAETAVRVLMCCALCLTAFKVQSIKDFFRCAAALFAVNFAYSGAMIAVWYLFKPNGMVINNSVVYFNISPLFLILFSVLGYFITVALKRILQKSFPEHIKCKVKFYCNNKVLNLDGIADTGNSLKDCFGMSQIFITEKSIVDILLDGSPYETRYRAIPCATVTGAQILDGYRIENAEVMYNNRKFEFKNPVLAVSREGLKDCQVIVNPEIIN